MSPRDTLLVGALMWVAVGLLVWAAFGNGNSAWAAMIAAVVLAAIYVWRISI
jgi:hypothetical protein